MASDVAAAAAKRKAKQAAPPPRPRIYFGRFYVVYLALALAVCASIVGVVLATRSGGTNGPSQTWSAWHPTGGGLGLSEQIAAHVGKEYRLANGFQAVTVAAEAPIISYGNQSHLHISFVTIRGGKSTGDIVAGASPSSTVMYRLCGLGQRCALTNVTETPALGQFLRREILELALYTFHYNSAIHSIIAFPPPASATTSSEMVYIQRSDLASELTQPLAQTLNPRTPTPQTITRADTLQVEKLTGPRTYSFFFQEAQDGNAGFVLTHLP